MVLLFSNLKLFVCFIVSEMLPLCNFAVLSFVVVGMFLS